MTSMEALSVTLAVIVVWQYLYSKSLQAQVDRIEILQIDQLSKQISRIEQELERIKDAPHKDYDAPSALGSPELKSTDLVREDHDQIAPEEGSLEEMRQEKYSEMSEISEISEISELLSDGAATFDDQNSTRLDRYTISDMPSPQHHLYPCRKDKNFRLQTTTKTDIAESCFSPNSPLQLVSTNWRFPMMAF